MKRQNAFVLSLFLFLTIFVPTSISSAAQTLKVGGVCTKAGITTKVGKLSLACVKSGKKLIWTKVSTPSINPLPSPSPTASSTLSPNPTPIMPSATSEPLSSNHLTFQNLLNNYKDVASIAYENTQLMLQANKDKEFVQSFTFRIAPGLTADPSKYQEVIKKANIFFANHQKPISFLGILYTSKDMDWAKEVFDKETGYADHDMMVKAPFGGDPNSTGGGANANTINNHGVTVFGYYKGFDTDPFVTSMSMAAHEYVHQIQMAQFNANRGDQGTQGNESIPCWITEGQANFNGIGIAATNFDDYLKFRGIQAHYLTLRNATVTGGQSDLNRTQLTPEYIGKYYDAMNITAGGSCIMSSQYGLGYSIGMLTVEALSSVKGAGSSMTLIQKLALGKTFEQAFNEVYGVNWADVKETLAQLVSKQLQEIL